MYAYLGKKGYPSEFPVRTKCILMFQKIHGVDVLLFVMYVHEYDQVCSSTNTRRVYISYLDSVKYFEPSCYRTLAYHSILVEYLRYIKMHKYGAVHHRMEITIYSTATLLNSLHQKTVSFITGM